ncbi:ribonuclease H1-like [Belonocnema kinseyi]|uniref:ribonuclease H1-like n=1 Tax=Belonocnema kinseyi TaxID=2817044 RepID=UPI00143D2937|nr:ribonuclease H1-like [Belonocnema kinseyi]
MGMPIAYYSKLINYYEQVYHEPEKGMSGSSVFDTKEDCAAKRLPRRRATEACKNITRISESSSETESPNETESSEDSDPPVFRKAYSVLPSLEPTLSKKDKSLPKITPPATHVPCPWFSPFVEPRVEVYIDGDCSFSENQRVKVGIGVWFGPNHRLKVSKSAEGRKTNNVTEINAAKKAEEGGIKEICLRKIQNVTWEHIPRHRGIEGNEEADRLAREMMREEENSTRGALNKTEHISDPS